MQLQVLSTDGILYQGEVVLVQLPGTAGSFEILQNHAPLMSLLDAGKIKVIDQQRNKFYIDIPGGTVEVNQDNIVVLTH